MIIMIFRGQVIIQRQVKFFHGKYKFRVFIDFPQAFHTRNVANGPII